MTTLWLWVSNRPIVRKRNVPQGNACAHGSPQPHRTVLAAAKRARNLRAILRGERHACAGMPELLDELATKHKIMGDPRITQIGQWLRKYSLDELPQLLNVLRGEMSLVGPRMISPPELKNYGQWAMNLLTVRPGITGLWQVSGRSDISYDDRVRLDMFYIRNYSIWLDLHLLMRTFPVVFSGKGAY